MQVVREVVVRLYGDFVLMVSLFLSVIESSISN